LYPEDTRKLINDGVGLMMKTTIKLLSWKDDSSNLALNNRDLDMPHEAEDDQGRSAGGDED
jgi:hypothetical protein